MNSQREEELKPCPFCGSTRIGIVDGVMHEGWKFHKVFCKSCQMRTEPIQGKGPAIARWNTRQAATEQGVGEAVGGMKKITAEIWVPENFNPDNIPTGTVLYTHPPKPTGGGVPDKVTVNSLVEASRCLGIAQYKFDFDAVRHWEQQVSLYRTLLATQQPPEQE